jgi:hypothetical protein
VADSHHHVEPIPCPPAVSSLWLPFLLVRPGQTVSAVFARPSWWSCYTHWQAHHTLYCPGAARSRCHETCPPGAPRWTAYTVVCVGSALIPHILHWHGSCHLWCPPLDRDQGRLTGQGITLRRLGDAPNSPLRIEFGANGLGRALPVVQDVRSYLSRLWSIPL